MTDILKTSLNLKGDLKRRLQWYCEANDLQPSQAVKMFVIGALEKYAKCPHVDTSSRTRVDDKNLSLDKSKDAKSESHKFFKGFIYHINFCEAPERVSKQIKDKSQLPEISRFDPQALVIGLRPGDICLIERSSVTAMKTNYYRVCV